MCKAFRRQSQIKEDRMLELLSTSESTAPATPRRFTSGYPGELLQNAKNAKNAIADSVAQRRQKIRKALCAKSDKLFGAMDASLGTCEDVAIGRFEDFLQDAAVDLF